MRTNQGGAMPMANEQHLRLLTQGKEVWNAWRQEYHQIHPDLENADLTGMKHSLDLCLCTDLLQAILDI
jgi:hypothetical protein